MVINRPQIMSCLKSVRAVCGSSMAATHRAPIVESGDTSTSEEILRLLFALHDEGNAVVLVTHDPSIGSRAPRLVVLRDGRIESDRRRTA